MAAAEMEGRRKGQGQREGKQAFGPLSEALWILEAPLCFPRYISRASTPQPRWHKPFRLANLFPIPLELPGGKCSLYSQRS